MLVEFKKRHDYVVERLNAIEGIECLPSDGTFYVFPSVSKFIQGIDGVEDDMALGEYLIEKAGVALVPGGAFGMGGHIRLSVATSMENLEQALDRIASLA